VLPKGNNNGIPKDYKANDQGYRGPFEISDSLSVDSSD